MHVTLTSKRTHNLMHQLAISCYVLYISIVGLNTMNYSMLKCNADLLEILLTLLECGVYYINTIEMHNNFQFLIFTCRSANTNVAFITVCDTAKLHCGTGCGISVAGHITGGEYCLHCSCVCPYESVKKRTEHRKVNQF